MILAVLPCFYSWSPLVFHILVLSFLHLFLSLSLSPVDQSGSVGSGVPLVNSIRIDSALIGGTKLLYLCIFFTGLYL